MFDYTKKNLKYLGYISKYSKLLFILFFIQKILNFFVFILIKLKIKSNYQNSFNIIDFDYIIKNEIGYFYIRNNTDDEYIVSSLFEDELKNYFTIDNGWIFFDIWTHIWKYSIKMAKENRENIVYSFEANRSTYKSLLINIIKNDLSNITAINKWISDKKWEISFLESKKDTWISRIVSTDINNIKWEITKIETISIDEFILENHIDINMIKLIKIDVEWHELQVLKWMKNLLHKNKNIKIICEVTNNEQDIINQMKDLDYLWKKIIEWYYLFSI